MPEINKMLLVCIAHNGQVCWLVLMDIQLKIRMGGILSRGQKIITCKLHILNSMELIWNETSLLKSFLKFSAIVWIS